MCGRFWYVCPKLHTLQIIYFLNRHDARKVLVYVRIAYTKNHIFSKPAPLTVKCLTPQRSAGNTATQLVSKNCDGTSLEVCVDLNCLPHTSGFAFSQVPAPSSRMSHSSLGEISTWKFQFEVSSRIVERRCGTNSYQRLDEGSGRQTEIIAIQLVTGLGNMPPAHVRADTGRLLSKKTKK